MQKVEPFATFGSIVSKLALQSSNHHAALWIGSCATGVASSVTYSTGCAGPASTYQGRLLGILQIEPEKPKVTLEGDDKRSMLRLLHHLRGILFSLGLSLYVLFSHRALSSWSHLRNFHHFLHHLAIRLTQLSTLQSAQWKSAFDHHSWGNEDHLSAPFMKSLASCLDHWNLHDLFYGLNLWNSNLFHNRHIYDLAVPRMSLAEAQLVFVKSQPNFKLRAPFLVGIGGDISLQWTRPFSQTAESNVPWSLSV